MKPEQASKTLLGITRSKAKMYEYGVPMEHHINIPRDPAQLFRLTIGLLGDFSAENNRSSGGAVTFPAILNEWEKQVLFKESRRKGFKAWYRNPNRASQESLGIAYDEGGESKIVRPDFLFFGELPDGRIAVDVVDPHGTHLADALPKLKGLAQYAEAHAEIYRRFESIAAVDGKMRVLDLTDARVRGAVQVASDVLSLFGSTLAEDY